MQSARESARRTQCGNKVKQLALALLGYDSANGCLPPGMATDQSPFGLGVATGSPGNRGSTWLAYVLPGLELGTLHDKLEFRNNSGFGNATNADLIAGLEIPAFRCPSSSLPQMAANRLSNGRHSMNPHYYGISGAADTPNNDMIPGFVETRFNEGVGWNGGILGGGGVLFPNSQISWGHVKDGLSQCLLIGEQSDFITTLDGTKNAWTCATGAGCSGPAIPSGRPAIAATPRASRSRPSGTRSTKRRAGRMAATAPALASADSKPTTCRSTHPTPPGPT